MKNLKEQYERFFGSLNENNQEKASLRLILHLDKKFPTKQKGQYFNER